MKRVLVIDDEPDFRAVMSDMLREDGWHVLLAAEGEEGIKLAKEHKPQIVLCDLLMPGCNGFQVCRSIRTDESLRDTKIVVTSGRDFAADRRAALAAGADEYLVKPVESARLLRLLATLLKRKSASPGPPLAASCADPAATCVRFWGVRGSIPTPGAATVKYGGNTSCVEVRADGQIVILDAGTGLRLLGRQLLEEFDHQPLELTLLLTHTHWDHIQGLPFFLPVYKPQNHLLILGYEGARHGLHNVLTSQMESPFFPIGLREVPANVRIEELKELTFHIGPIRVEACFANHPGICVGYRLFTSEGSIAFFPDNEPYQVKPRGQPPQPDREPAALQYARSQHKRLLQFLRGVDVLIMDSQYDYEEYQEHVGWGHGCLDDVVSLALEAEARRLVLFHHDPEHDDSKIDAMVAHGRAAADGKGELQIEAAREGAVVELPVKESAAV